MCEDDCLNQLNNTNTGGTISSYPYDQHLFKKLLIACCDSCERRASLIVPNFGNSGFGGSGNDDDDDDDTDNGNDNDNTNINETLSTSIALNLNQLEQHRISSAKDDPLSGDETDDEDDNVFECPEENKAEMHDVSSRLKNLKS